MLFCIRHWGGRYISENKRRFNTTISRIERETIRQVTAAFAIAYSIFMAGRNSGNKLQFAESIKATNPHSGYKKVRYTDKNTFRHCDNNFVSLVSIIR